MLVDAELRGISRGPPLARKGMAPDSWAAWTARHTIDVSMARPVRPEWLPEADNTDYKSSV
eukprot:scaffold183240_cov26-Prasinocladus_malaysianus.AAC.1